MVAIEKDKKFVNSFEPVILHQVFAPNLAQFSSKI